MNTHHIPTDPMLWERDLSTARYVLAMLMAGAQGADHAALMRAWELVRLAQMDHRRHE